MPHEFFVSKIPDPDRMILCGIVDMAAADERPPVSHVALGRLFWLRTTNRCADGWELELEEIPNTCWTDPVEALIEMLRLKGVHMEHDRLQFLTNLKSYVDAELKAGAGEFHSEGPKRKDGDE